MSSLPSRQVSLPSLLLSFSSLALLISTTSAVYNSDSGCPCSNTANGTFSGGCRLRPLGFDNVTSGVTWCLTDQEKSPGCGTMSAFGFYADYCVNAGFTTVEVLPNQVLLDPGQDQWTFYTSQRINLTWSSTITDIAERVTFSVYTPTLRSVFGTSGGVALNENITVGNVRTLTISTSTNNPVSTVGGPSPVLFSTVAGSINANSEVRVKNSSQFISVFASRITSVQAFLNNSLLTATTAFPSNDYNITVRWTALGFARYGTVAISFQRCSSGFGGGTTCSQTNPNTGGGGTQLGTTLTIPLSTFPMTTTTFEAIVPMVRSTGINSNTNHQVFVRVTQPSGTQYDYGSIGFVLGPAPTPSPSPTRSQTPTGSPTGTPSGTPTGSKTPSPTATPTGTPTATGTPSPTKSPVDLLTAILKEQAEKQKAEAEATKAATSGIVGGVVGGVIFVALLGFVIFKVIQRRQSAERRQRKLAASRRATQDRESVYGVTIATVDKPSEKDIVNLAAYKAAAKAQNNPMTKASSLSASAAKSNSLNAPAAKTVGRGSGRNINRV